MDLYGELAAQYQSGSVHALSTFLERQVRFAACVERPVLGHRRDLPGLPRRVGLGGYVAYLASLAQHAIPEDVARLNAGLIASLDTSPFPDRDQSLKVYRDFLAHGGVEPGGVLLVETLESAVAANAERITLFIEGRGGIERKGDRIVFRSGESLDPFIISLGEHFGTFQSLHGGELVYYTNNPSEPLHVRVQGSDQHRTIADEVAPPPRADDAGAAEALIESIQRDLKGFRDRGTQIELSGRYSPFEVSWAWSTSTGSELRTDHFRVAVSREWQWRSPEGWQPYAEFLRLISNWPVVVSRSRMRLQTIEQQRQDADILDFGRPSDLTVPEAVKARLVPTETIGSSLKRYSADALGSLVEVVDEAARTATGVPQIFFVTGEAGIGKTFNLIRESLHRADRLDETTLDEPEPLYLFISCSGVGVNGIDKLINDAVVETRNLNFEAVLALCRRGLVVLVVDGFDELIGGAGYRDALQVLQPVLRGLGTHGTLLLSARSSYSANQYRASLEALRDAGEVPPDHLITELQRWTKSDVEALFDANPAWIPFRGALTSGDKALLGIPFFAHTFGVHVSDGATPADFQSMRSLLIDSYLHRESRKLASSGAQDDVGLPDLRRVFVEVAGLMYESAQPSLDKEDFLFACASALGLDDEFDGAHRRLGDRMTVLCGFTAERNDGPTAVFAFQHEIFYDVFLGEYLSERCVGSGFRVADIERILSLAPLGQTTAESMVSNSLAEPLADMLRTAIGRVATSEGAVHEKDPRTNLSANLATLTQAYVAAHRRLPVVSLRGLSFIELDLSTVSGVQLVIENCRVGRLVLNLEASDALTMRESIVDSLCIATFGDLGPLEVDERCRFGELEILSPQDRSVIHYESSNESVLRRLVNSGARGLNKWVVRNAADEQPNWLEHHAAAALTKMGARGSTTYVIEKASRRPGDTASAWMPNPNSEAWVALTSCLVDAGLAHEKPLTAGGAAKLMILLDAPAIDIADRESDDPAIRAFWSRLHVG